MNLGLKCNWWTICRTSHICAYILSKPPVNFYKSKNKKVHCIIAARVLYSMYIIIVLTNCWIRVFIHDNIQGTAWTMKWYSFHLRCLVWFHVQITYISILIYMHLRIDLDTWRINNIMNMVVTLPLIYLCAAGWFFIHGMRATGLSWTTSNMSTRQTSEKRLTKIVCQHCSSSSET